MASSNLSPLASAETMKIFDVLVPLSAFKRELRDRECLAANRSAQEDVNGRFLDGAFEAEQVEVATLAENVMAMDIEAVRWGAALSVNHSRPRRFDLNFPAVAENIERTV